MVTCQPYRCGARRGGLPSLSPAYLAFSLLPCPLSPSPFPNGEGEIYGYFMQGAPPLASPGLSPSGAGSRGEPLAQRGACPVGCRLTLPPLYLPGGVLSLSPACPAFSLLPCPLSPSPFPNGEGEIYGYFMQGAPPLASPAFNRLRHLQTLSNMNPAEGLPGWSPADLAAAVPGGGLNPSGTCSPCPGGEDRLKRRRRLRRIVPSPPIPLSLAAGTAHGKAVLSVLRRTAGSHAQGTRLAGSVSAAGG